MNNIATYKIYCLKDHQDKIFYIGSTKAQYLSKRRSNHLDNSKMKLEDGNWKNDTIKDKYIRHIDHKFTIELLEEIECDRETAYDREDHYILLYKPICNTAKARSIPPMMGGHNKKLLPKHIMRKLGKMPDYDLAAVAGVCKTVIARARKAAGIESYAAQTGNDGRIKEGENHRRWNWPHKNIEPKYAPKRALRRIS